MKDHHDTRTIDAFEKRGAGRPRRYASNAERQAAYRARQRQGITVDVVVPSVSASAAVQVTPELVLQAARDLVAELMPADVATMPTWKRLQIVKMLEGAELLVARLGGTTGPCADAWLELNDAAIRVAS